MFWNFYWSNPKELSGDHKINHLSCMLEFFSCISSCIFLCIFGLPPKLKVGYVNPRKNMFRGFVHMSRLLWAYSWNCVTPVLFSKFRHMLGVSVEVYMKNILHWFIRGQTHLAPLGMSKWVWPLMNRYRKFIVQISTLTPRMHQKLSLWHGNILENNQLPTKTPPKNLSSIKGYLYQLWQIGKVESKCVVVTCPRQSCSIVYN